MKKLVCTVGLCLSAVMEITAGATAQAAGPATKPDSGQAAPEAVPEVAPETEPKAEPKAAAPAIPADDKDAALRPALAKLQFQASQLPKGVTFGEGSPCVSVQAMTFFERPSLGPKMPAPLGKVAQSFRRGKDVLGTVLAFEYEGDVPQAVHDFLPALIWGEAGPTARHPERILFHGSCAVVLSFPEGEPLAAWFKAQLQSRLGMPASSDWANLQPMLDSVIAAYGRQDAKAGRAILKKNAAAIHDYAFAQYFLGEFASMDEDAGAAEVAYARAVELDDGGSDRLPDPPNILWAALDGLGSALLLQGKHEAALPVLQRVVDSGRSRRVDADLAHGLYNFACCLAQLKRFDESLAALSEGIKLDPALRQLAGSDTDLAEAVKRPEFRKLISG